MEYSWNLVSRPLTEWDELMQTVKRGPCEYLLMFGKEIGVCRVNVLVKQLSAFKKLKV